MATLDELIGSWALSLRAANRAPRTVARYVDESLAQFRRWLAEHEPDLAPAAIARQHVEAYLGGRGRRGSSQPHGERPPPSSCRSSRCRFSDAELRPFLTSARPKGFADQRDTATIRLLLDTGMRWDELVGLRLADVDVVGHVAVVLAKARRERGCPFGDKTAVAPHRYLRVRKTHRLADSEWLTSQTREGRETKDHVGPAPRTSRQPVRTQWS